MARNTDVSNLKVENPTQRVDEVESKYSGNPYDWGVTVGYEPRPALEDIPNYDKLTRTERWVMDKLPGFAESNVGQALERFNNTLAGKALQFLDVGAEALERTVGLGAQWANADDAEREEISNNLRYAWQAGSMFSDLANAPIFRDGKMIVPYELPGLAGVVQARKRLMAGEDLETVRGSMLNDLGALALRAQKQDALFHIIGDPLNLILPMIKPVEAVNSARIALLSTGALPEQIATHLDDIARLTKIAGSVDEIADLSKLSDEVGDVAKLTNIVDDLAAQGVKVGKQELLDELLRLEQKALEVRALTPAEQKFLRFSGGIPGVEDTSTLGKIGTSRWNPFALTPEARSIEMVERVTNNISSYLLGKDLSPDEIVRAIKRAADGTLGPQFGHMIITPEGRIVKGALQGFAADAEDMYRAYEALSFEREALKVFGLMTGEDVHDVVRLLDDPDAAKAFFQRVVDAAEQNPNFKPVLDDLLARGNLSPESFTPELLEGIRKVIGDSDIYTEELFRTALFTKIADATAQHGVTLFGVKQQGVLRQAADTLKAAESLAFLRLNPTYPIKNYINNLFTNVARGNWGTISMDARQATKFWDEVLGFVPPRALQGVTAGELAELSIDGSRAASLAGVKGLSKGATVVMGELKGGGGWMRRVQDSISNFGLKKGDDVVDFGRLAQKIESDSSSLAMMSGYRQGWRRFWKEGAGFDKVIDHSPELVEELGEEAAKSIERAIASSLNEEQIRRIVFEGDNINLNIRNILDGAADDLGFDIHDVLDEGFIASIQDDLLAGAKNGNLPDVMAGIRNKMDAHIQDMADNALETLVDETEALTTTERSGAFTKLWSQVSDDMWATQERHAMNMQRLGDDIRDVADPAIRNQRWRSMKAESDRYYTRFWDRQEARFEGLSRAMKKSEIPHGDKLTDNFKAWRKEWKTFYSKRNTMMDEYFDAVLEGKTPKRSFDEIQNELDLFYNRAIGLEDVYTRQMDSLLGNMLPAEQRSLFLAFREEVADYRFADKQLVIDFREKIKTALPEERPDLWNEHWRNRMTLWDRVHKTEQQGLAALEGNAQAASKWAEAAVERAPRDEIIYQANRLGVATATEAGQPIDNVAASTVNKYVRGEYRTGKTFNIDIDQERRQQDLAEITESAFFQDLQRKAAEKRGIDPSEVQSVRATDNIKNYESLADIPPELAEKSFKQRLIHAAANDRDIRWPDGLNVDEFKAYVKSDNITQAERLLDELQGVTDNVPAMTDFHATVPRSRMDAIGYDQLNFNRASMALDALEDNARRIASEPPLKFNDLSPQAQDSLRGYISAQEGNLADARNASLRFAEFKRDSALLNYSRRTNFDTWASTIFPYEFWVTHSIYNWALHSIDRPAMMSTFFRMKKFLDTGFRPESGFPSRLKGHIRVNVPFLPKEWQKWMGDQLFINPLDAAIPLSNFTRPAEEYLSQNMRDEGKVEYVLEEQLQDGSITREQYLDATQTRQGKVWEQAMALARLDDTEGRLNGVDLATMLTAPHAPLMWAYRASQGKTDEIGPFLPITRTIKGVTGMLGINAGEGLNPEAKIREFLGLHPFDKWEDYRAERMLVSMIATGEIDAIAGKRAMLSHEGNEWLEAQRRAGIEFGISALGSTLGLPTKAYPVGEEIVREKSEQYQAAWELYEQGNKDALFDWLDENPDYEARLALFKTPEERLNRFLVDEIWDKYNGALDVDKRLIRDALGEEFVNSFLVKETRSTGSIPPEQLSVWLKLLGGDPIGTLGGKVAPLQFAPREEAQLAQFFYDTRRAQFPNFFELQEGYYALPKDKRGAYLAQNPTLKAYWDWRRDFMQRNPQAVKYLTDNEEQLQEAAGQIFEGDTGPDLLEQEVLARVQAVGGQSLAFELSEWQRTGQLDPVARDLLLEIADEIGISLEILLSMID